MCLSMNNSGRLSAMAVKVILVPCILLWLFASPCRLHLPIANRGLYVRRFDAEHGTNVSLTKGVSETDCARRCKQRLLCRRFAYSNAKKKCYFSPDTLLESRIRGATYGRYCPIGHGYEYNVIDSRYRCLKTTHAEMNYTDGMGKCLSEGAHMFTLDSQADMDFIFSKGAATAWIDGGQYLRTYVGMSLPWTAWKTGHPMTDFCPFVSNVHGMLTTGCYTPNVVPVCQIDV